MQTLNPPFIPFTASSGNGGATWSDGSMGISPAVPVFDIEQDDEGSIFVATHGSGAYRLPPPLKVRNVLVPSVVSQKYLPHDW